MTSMMRLLRLESMELKKLMNMVIKIKYHTVNTLKLIKEADSIILKQRTIVTTKIRRVKVATPLLNIIKTIPKKDNGIGGIMTNLSSISEDQPSSHIIMSHEAITLSSLDIKSLTVREVEREDVGVVASLPPRMKSSVISKTIISSSRERTKTITAPRIQKNALSELNATRNTVVMIVIIAVQMVNTAAQMVDIDKIRPSMDSSIIEKITIILLETMATTMIKMKAIEMRGERLPTSKN